MSRFLPLRKCIKSIFLDFVKIFLPLVTGYFTAKLKLPMNIAFNPFHVSYTRINRSFLVITISMKTDFKAICMRFLNLIKLSAIYTNLFIENYDEDIVHSKSQLIRDCFLISYETPLKCLRKINIPS